MKKEITMFLTALLVLFVFTGCGSGKSEAEKAVEEFGRQIKEEAAKDGVDLAEMLKQEKAASESRMASKSEIREAKQAVKAELDAQYDPQLQEEFDALIAASTAEDTLAHGSRYNELIEERNALGKAADVSWGGKSNYVALDASYISKAMFLSTTEYRDWEYKVFCRSASSFSSSAEDRIMLVFGDDKGTGSWKELVFVKEDGSVCKLDLGSIFEPGSSISIDTVSESAVQLCAIEHSDWNWYLFDIRGPEGVLTAKSTELSVEAYNAKLNDAISRDDKMGEAGEYAPFWNNTLEDLNKMILHNTMGCAADRCSYK